MLDNKIKIRRVYQTSGTSPTGGVEQKHHYEYLVGPHGPFITTFGAGEHTPDKVHERLNGMARTLRETGALEPAAEG